MIARQTASCGLNRRRCAAVVGCAVQVTRSVVGRMVGLSEKLEPTQYAMPPLSVHRAPDGFGDTTEGIKGFRGTW